MPVITGGPTTFPSTSTVNSSFDSIVATTLNNYRKKLEDNVSTQNALWWKLKESNRVQSRSGGVYLVEQLISGLNSTAKSYRGYDTLDLTPQDGISAAHYDWRQVAVSIVLSGLEKIMNNGQEQVVDLLKAKVQQAEISLAEKFGDMLIGDGTGNSSKDFLGIKALIGDNSSTVTTVGNIDSTVAGNAFWRSYVERTAAVLTLAHIRTAFNKAVRGPVKPDFAMTTLTLYEKYESLLQTQQRFTDPKMGEAGFVNLLHHTAPIVWDQNLTDSETGAWYFLNTDFISLKRHSDVWFKSTPSQRPDDQDATASVILSAGNLTISNRKLGGSKLEGKTA